MESLRRNGQVDRGDTGFPAQAFAWSLGLHGVMLLSFMSALPEGEVATIPHPATRLDASLVAISRPAAVPPAPTFPAPPRLPPSVPEPESLAAVQRIEAIADPTDVAVSPAPTFAGQESVLTHQPVATRPASVALPPEMSDAPAPDAAGLRQYRLALASEARRYRRYPEAARRAGQEGMVEVRIDVTAGARETALARSSGFDSLDRAALEMMRQAAVRASLPESLREQRFAVLLPVVFTTED